MEDKKGTRIWNGGITKPNGNDKRMSEEEAKFGEDLRIIMIMLGLKVILVPNTK